MTELPLVEGMLIRWRRALKRNRNAVEDCGKANRVLHRLALQPAFGEVMLMRLHAHAAAIDRRDGERPQLEIDAVHAGIGDRLHAQPRRQAAILLVADEMGEAVVDVVHPHQRRRRARRHAAWTYSLSIDRPKS